MPVSIISRTSKAKNMKKLRKKILVLEIVWNQPYIIFIKIDLKPAVLCGIIRLFRLLVSIYTHFWEE